MRQRVTSPRGPASCWPSSGIFRTSLCAPNATVVWTRHRRPPDVTPAIRDWFATAGFDEVAFEGPDGFIFGVGVHRLSRDPDPFAPEARLFEFVGSDQTWP